MKRLAGNQLMLRSLMLSFLFLGLQACGGGGGATNVAPVVSAVSITDNNGGTAAYKDTLTASYTYSDAEGNAEGTTTFIWLRNGTAISGATASTYTLAVADTEQAITLAVTPVASAGTTTGSSVTSTGLTVDALPNQDSSGIYNGTAKIDSNNTDILDLSGIIYNNRFMLFSRTASTHVLYDGAITSITKYNYAGKVNVYENGVKTETDVVVTGNVLTSESITGIMGTPGNAGNHNGTFSLTFSDAYNRAGTTARIESTGFKQTTGTTYGRLNQTNDRYDIRTDFSFAAASSTCDILAEIYVIPDTTVNIYTIDNIDIVDSNPGSDVCLDTYEGSGFSGLISVVDDGVGGTDNRILIAYTNNTNSVFSLLTKP